MSYHSEVANDELTSFILQKAIDIHEALGPGLAEAKYQEILCEELEEEGLRFEVEHRVVRDYKGKAVDIGRADLWIEESLVIELKVVRQLRDAHFLQLGRYVKALKASRGLLVNFGGVTVESRRYANSQNLAKEEEAEAEER